MSRSSIRTSNTDSALYDLLCLLNGYERYGAGWVAEDECFCDRPRTGGGSSLERAS